MKLNWIRSGMKPLAVCALGLAMTSHALATSLVDDYRDALRADATYATATADVEIQRIQAQIAGMAFYPQARLSLTQLDTDRASRSTIALVQPLISWDRWLTLQERSPREAAAQARLDVSQSELALRVFRAVLSLTDAREKVRLNANTVQALEVQELGARRAFELGQGTVTDLRDTQLRLAQARSQTFVLQAALEAANRQYNAVVGRPPMAQHYPLSTGPVRFAVPDLTAALDRARSLNPSIRAASVGVRLSELAQRRASAQFVPSVNAVAQRSESGGNTINSSQFALRLEVPITAASVMQRSAAAVEVRRSQDAERDARLRVELEVERLHAQVSAAQAELAVRREAVQAAALSVEANEQSFKGGVRSKIDVLNALQAQFQAQADLAAAQLRLGEALLSLQLACGADIAEALALVQATLFAPAAPPAAARPAG